MLSQCVPENWRPCARQLRSLIVHFACAYTVENNEGLRAECERAEASNDELRTHRHIAYGNLWTLIPPMSMLTNAFTMRARKLERMRSRIAFAHRALCMCIYCKAVVLNLWYSCHLWHFDQKLWHFSFIFTWHFWRKDVKEMTHRRSKVRIIAHTLAHMQKKAIARGSSCLGSNY